MQSIAIKCKKNSSKLNMQFFRRFIFCRGNWIAKKNDVIWEIKRQTAKERKKWVGWVMEVGRKSQSLLHAIFAIQRLINNVGADNETFLNYVRWFFSFLRLVAHFFLNLRLINVPVLIRCPRWYISAKEEKRGTNGWR